ncbi:DUF1501 domain-containing protein [bacterium]|nr:DUF1501 domain-containing protein [bacterium]
MANNITRRSFLKTSSLGAAGLALSPFLRPLVSVAAGSCQTAGNGKIALMINCLGGYDGYFKHGVVSGPAQPIFQSRRPTLYNTADLRVHHGGQSGNIIGVHKHYDRLLAQVPANQMRILLNCGITQNYSRSHDEAQTMWSLASTNTTQYDSGWQGRLIDLCGQDSFQLFGLFGSAGRIDFNTTDISPIVGYNPNSLVTKDRWGTGFHCHFCAPNSLDPNDRWFGPFEDEYHAREVLKKVNQLSNDTSQTANAYVRTKDAVESTVNTIKNEVNIINLAGEYRTQSQIDTNYNGGLDPFQLSCQFAAKIAKWIASKPDRNSKSHILQIGQGGYDTHSYQPGTLQNLLTIQAAGLAGFWADIKAAGLQNRVVVFIYSEFGRSVNQNGTPDGSVGSEHGITNHLMAFGGNVAGGVTGIHSSTNDLQNLEYIPPVTSLYDPLGDIVSWLGFDKTLVFNENLPSNGYVRLFT